MFGFGGESRVQMMDPQRLQTVTIVSRKFDGSVSRSWKCDLIEENDEILTFVGEFDIDVEHPDLGFIRRGTVSYEYYWRDRWFNVFRFHEPEGEIRNYYCNINMPPLFENGVLDYVDLDIDVVVNADLRYRVLDHEDFEKNAVRFGYPEEVKSRVESSLSEVVTLIESRDFPFNYLG